MVPGSARRCAPFDPSRRARPNPRVPADSPPPPPATTADTHARPSPLLPSPPTLQGNYTPKPGQQARREIDAACAKGDADAAFAAFEAAVAAGDPLQPHSCNVLLHLCSGGVTGGTYDAAPETKAVVPPRDAVHPERANAIFNHMVANDIPRTEMTYTALARVEAAMGKPRAAFDLVARLPDERLRPKLRTMAPAMHAFAAAGDIDGAMEVCAALAAANIERGEAEYAALLTAYRAAGRWDDGWNLLREMREEVRTLGEGLAEETRAFVSAAPGWSLEATVEVNDVTGACVSASGRHVQLAAANLSAADRTALLEGIGKLAREREAGDSFAGFSRWLARKGPLPYLVDGANVGMYNQNFKQSAFNFNQVERVMANIRTRAKEGQRDRRAAKEVHKTKAPEPEARAAEEKNTEEKHAEAEPGDGNADGNPKPAPPSDAELVSACASNVGAGFPVVFLHVRRVRGGPANHPKARRILSDWKNGGELFTTPAGSNDDWYWLYAAVASGDDTFLVSNDEMRDHVFQMLPSPRLFQRWKERHQVRFRLSAADGLELFYPPVFTTCVQEGGDGGWWMFPCDDGEWICATRDA